MHQGSGTTDVPSSSAITGHWLKDAPILHKAILRRDDATLRCIRQMELIIFSYYGVPALCIATRTTALSESALGRDHLLPS